MTPDEGRAAVAPAPEEARGARVTLDGIASRPLVPTRRQRTAGEGEPEYRFDAAGSAGGAPSLRERAGAWLARFDVRTLRGPRIPAAVLLAVAFFGQFDDLVFNVIGPELRVEFAAAPSILAAVAIVILLLQYATQPLYGWLVDRVPRVWLVRLAHVGGNVFSAASAFAASVAGFVAVRGVTNLLGIGSQTPAQTLVADYYEGESFARVMTLMSTVQTLATIVAPLVAGLIVSATNWRVAVFGLACLAVLVSLATFLLREPKRGEAERRALGERQDREEEPLPFAESWRIARSIATLRRIWYITPFLVAVGSFPILFVLALYFAEGFAMTAAQRGLVATLVGVSGLVGLTLVNPIASRVIEREPGRLMPMAGALMATEAVALAVLGFSRALPLSVAATVPLGIGVAVVPLLRDMVMLKVVPPRIRGLGVSSTAPWAILGLMLFGMSIAAGGRGATLALVPLAGTGALLFFTAGGNVARDVRAARASVRAAEAVEHARQSGATSLLVCRDVEVEYSGVQVLFGVDLDIADGEIVALLGTNGAGKSTLLRAIAGVNHASNGAILLDGRDITHEPGHAIAARGVVMMPGGKATFPSLTVRENLRAAAWLRREDAGAARAAIEEALGYFPALRARLDEVAGNLSGGEQQMVGLAQAFVMQPRLLLIDELSLGLAPAVVEQLLTILRAIHAKGTGIVLVEQSINVALTIAARAVFMEKGEVRFDGPTEELMRRPDLLRSVFIGAAHAAPARRARPAQPRAGARDVSRTGALQVEDVSVRFGGLRALDGATLDVAPGEIVGVIGPNGAGKTTLFDVISGFVRPDSGRVVFDGDDVTALPPHERARRRIARSFQNVRLFPALTVWQNIAVALEQAAVRSELMSALWLPPVRRAEEKIETRVEGLVEILGLEAFAGKFVRELSTGSRRAVEVACMMAVEPALLLLDEPSSGLAQAETEELGPVLARLARETGCAMLIIEHDLPLVMSVADRLVAMELGRVIAAGPPADVIGDERVVASYLAASQRVIARSDAGSIRTAIDASLLSGATEGESVT